VFRSDAAAEVAADGVRETAGDGRAEPANLPAQVAQTDRKEEKQMSEKTPTQADKDNTSGQKNPENPKYPRARGATEKEALNQVKQIRENNRARAVRKK